MAGITSSVGLGSGLEISKIVETLVNADTSAKNAQITRQTANNSAMISGIGALRSALTAFTTAMGKLNDKTTPSFNAYAATSANENVVKVTASNKAVAGTYSIAVENLATSSKVASQSFASSTDDQVSFSADTRFIQRFQRIAYHCAGGVLLFLRRWIFHDFARHIAILFQRIRFIDAAGDIHR